MTGVQTCALPICFPVTIRLLENRIGEIKEGGTPQFWVISNSFPTEIDAGMWENFNRFNLESLPRKDWLAPFGGISRISLGEGTLTADTSLTVVTESTITNPVLRADLPEVGAVSEAKQLPDAKEMSWKLHTVVDSVIDFFNLGGSKTIGTGYAAALLSTESEIDRVVETNGFLGAIWLNGKKIYDGYSLNPKTAVKVRLNKGINRLIVRASGISGDYWRKNGGWVAGLRIWSSETFAENAKAFSGSSDGKVFYLEGFPVTIGGASFSFVLVACSIASDFVKVYNFPTGLSILVFDWNKLFLIGLRIIPCSDKVLNKSPLVIFGDICFSIILSIAFSTIGCSGFLPSLTDFLTSLTHLSYSALS